MIYNVERTGSGKRSTAARILCLVFVMCIALGMLTGLTGCSAKEKLYVFNWGDYIDPDVIKLFEKNTRSTKSCMILSTPTRPCTRSWSARISLTTW